MHCSDVIAAKHSISTRLHRTNKNCIAIEKIKDFFVDGYSFFYLE